MVRNVQVNNLLFVRLVCLIKQESEFGNINSLVQLLCDPSIHHYPITILLSDPYLERTSKARRKEHAKGSKVRISQNLTRISSTH
ncbi:hypothetical protein YC2023_081666 [Brassica napus]